MMVDSSEGGLEQKSYMWFDVRTINIRYYQFWYYSYGDDSSKLYTMYDNNDKLITLDTKSRDRWMKTDCVALPSSFDGRIYIIAEHGGGFNEDLAVDNVQLTSNCNGKSKHLKLVVSV